MRDRQQSHVRGLTQINDRPVGRRDYHQRALRPNH